MEQPVIISIKSTQRPTGADQDEMELVTQGMLYGDEEEGYTLTYEETSLTGLEGTTTTFLVPSVIPLIPGSALYHTMNYALNKQWAAFAQQAFYTLQLALSLAVGIIAVTTLTRLLTALQMKRRQRTGHREFHHSIR